MISLVGWQKLAIFFLLIFLLFRCQPAPAPHQGPTKEERAIEAAKQRNRQQQLQKFSDPAHGPFHLLTSDRPTNTQLLKQQVSLCPEQCIVILMPPGMVALHLA